MMKLAMATLHSDLKPTVGLEQGDQFLNFHVVILPWALSCALKRTKLTGDPKDGAQAPPAGVRVERRVTRMATQLNAPARMFDSQGATNVNAITTTRKMSRACAMKRKLAAA